MQVSKSQKLINNAQETAVIFQVEGELSAGRDFEKFRKELMDEIRSGHRHAILDLGGVFYINSTGIGSLVAINREVSEMNGTLMIVNLHQALAQVFLSLNLFKMFRYYENVDTAIAGINLKLPESSPTNES